MQIETEVRLAVPYLRVSTDDKGQDPDRQLAVIRDWARREGVMLTPEVRDVGTSASKTDPFERARFVEAMERAVSAGAAAIVVEMGDRFSRQGTKLSDWAEVELAKRTGLKLWRADVPLKDHGTLSGDLVGAIKAELAREWVRNHSARVRGGMQTAKEKGKRFGRPPKPLTDEEVELVKRARAEGKGWLKVALEVNRARGLLEIADPAVRRRRGVTGMHLRRYMMGLSKSLEAPGAAPVGDVTLAVVPSRPAVKSRGGAVGSGVPLAGRTRAVKSRGVAPERVVWVDESGEVSASPPEQKSGVTKLTEGAEE